MMATVPVTPMTARITGIPIITAYFQRLASSSKAGPNEASAEIKMKRPPDKSMSLKITVFISQPKHMQVVLKRIVSVRQFF